jgi:ribose 5-phosphate isomerase B
MKKIAIGGDHAGFEYKSKLVEILKQKGYEVKDFGPFTADSCDYPDYVHPLAKSVEDKAFDFGIIICGSANGVNMVANKYQGVRSALCWLPEIAQLSRSHNDANIVAIPARFVSFETAEETIFTFLNTDFEGGRHQNRVNKIAIS